MNILKKNISILLTAVLLISIIQVGMISPSAEAMFDYGDYKFAVKSDDTLAVAGYYGTKVNLELPDHVEDRKVTGVYARCFENSDIETVALPTLYTTIDAFAFVNCASLRSIVIPSELVSIGTMAFSSCKSLESVDFSGAQNLRAISYGAFSGCSSLKSVSLPDTITVLGENVFTKCSSLSEAELPNGITTVPEYTFYGCTSLGYVDIPDSVNIIETSAFENAAALREVFIPDAVETIEEDSFSPEDTSGETRFFCYTGSYAEEYFDTNGFSDYRVIDKVQGDFNLDGMLDITDSTRIQKYCAGLIGRPLRQALEAGNVSGDSGVSVRDATLIQMRLADIIADF